MSWNFTDGVNGFQTSLIPNTNAVGYLKTENEIAATSADGDKVLAVITASRSSAAFRRSPTELGSDTILRERANAPHHRL